MSTDNKAMSFAEGDEIKFQLLGTLEADGQWLLPKGREATYVGLSVYERNGEELAEPVFLETGFYNDQWTQAEKPDLSKLWSAKLVNGIRRATEEDRGKWVNPFGPFLNLSTLVITSEPVPVRGVPHQRQPESRPAP